MARGSRCVITHCRPVALSCYRHRRYGPRATQAATLRHTSTCCQHQTRAALTASPLLRRTTAHQTTDVRAPNAERGRGAGIDGAIVAHRVHAPSVNATRHKLSRWCVDIGWRLQRGGLWRRDNQRQVNVGIQQTTLYVSLSGQEAGVEATWVTSEANHPKPKCKA